MIDRLGGVIIEEQPPLVLIEVDGIGYEVHMPMTCFYELPETGQEAIVFIHFVVYEDVQLPCGFSNKQERTLFKEPIRTNGVGPKLALAILSEMPMQQFTSVVEREEVGTLVKLLGIGRKIAEHLTVEMRDQFRDLHGDPSTSTADLVLTSPTSPTTDDAEQEMVAALVALGYKPQETSRMVSKIARPDASSKTLIRGTLRAVLRGKR